MLADEDGFMLVLSKSTHVKYPKFFFEKESVEQVNKINQRLKKDDKGEADRRLAEEPKTNVGGDFAPGVGRQLGLPLL